MQLTLPSNSVVSTSSRTGWWVWWHIGGRNWRLSSAGNCTVLRYSVHRLPVMFVRCMEQHSTSKVLNLLTFEYTIYFEIKILSLHLRHISSELFVVIQNIISDILIKCYTITHWSTCCLTSFWSDKCEVAYSFSLASVNYCRLLCVSLERQIFGMTFVRPRTRPWCDAFFFFILCV